MSASRNERLDQIVQPFANLMNGPGRVLPTQAELDMLRGYYSAHDNGDFHLPPDYVPQKQDVSTKHHVMLPFSLALGLHPAGPAYINEDATRRTFDVYSRTGLLAVITAGIPFEHHVQRYRAEGVLASTIVRAAVDPPTRISFSHDKLEHALTFSTNEGLLPRGMARHIRRTIEIVTLR